jgi:hypothetical protein
MDRARALTRLLIVGGLACLTCAAPTSASAPHPARRSACQRLKGDDLAPAPSVKLYRRDGSLTGCVLPRGPIRSVASSEDDEAALQHFHRRDVLGAFVLFDLNLNVQYVSGGWTAVYNLRTGQQYFVARDLRGPGADRSDHFTAPAAFVDAHGRAIAALVSTKDATGVTVLRFDVAGAPEILDQGSVQELPPKTLSRTGATVSWRHSGVLYSASFG